MQAGLIIGLLLLQGAERKSSSSAGKRRALPADGGPGPLPWSGYAAREGTVACLNDRRLDFTGSGLTLRNANVWPAFIHPDDLQHVLKANAKALQQRKEYSKEYRFRRRDGACRWMLDIAAPRVNSDGSLPGLLVPPLALADQNRHGKSWKRSVGN